MSSLFSYFTAVSEITIMPRGRNRRRRNSLRWTDLMVFLLYLDGRCWRRLAESPGQKCEIHSGSGQSLRLSSARVLWEQSSSHSTDLETKHTCGTFENLQRTEKVLLEGRYALYNTCKILNSYPSGTLLDGDQSVNRIGQLSLGWSSLP